MDLAAPIIYSPNESPARASVWARLLGVVVALGCLTVMLTAASLPPSHDGLATHRGLGMPACEFYDRTGVPCPACGMTTSFAWFVRGNFAASVYVQPMGALLAVMACSAIWAGLYIGLTGRPIYRLLALTTGRYLLIPLLSFATAAWGWKILIHLTKHDGW